MLAEAGQFEPALAAARAITDPDLRAGALAQVARGLARAGQPKQATAAGEQALIAARATTSPSLRADALAEVARVLAEARQPERAAAAESALHAARATTAIRRAG